MRSKNVLDGLNKAISTMEVNLGMNVSVNGSSLKELPLYDFLLVCQKAVKSANRNQLIKYSSYITQFSRNISYLNERLTFSNEQVLDFQLYDNADVLCCFFLQFQEHRDIESFKKKELSSFIKYIEICEKNNSNIKRTLSYRTMRLFLTFVCMGFHVDASVISQFLRNQFWISEGFNPRSKLSTSERTKIVNSIKSDRFKYSKKFKAKMKNAIVNVVKNTDISSIKEEPVVADYKQVEDDVNTKETVQPNEVKPEIINSSVIDNVESVESISDVSDTTTEVKDDSVTKLDKVVDEEILVSPISDKPVADKSVSEKPIVEEVDKPVLDKLVSDKSVSEKPVEKNPSVNYGSRKVVRSADVGNSSKPASNKTDLGNSNSSLKSLRKKVTPKKVIKDTVEDKVVPKESVDFDNVIYNDVISSDVFEPIVKKSEVIEPVEVKPKVTKPVDTKSTEVKPKVSKTRETKTRETKTRVNNTSSADIKKSTNAKQDKPIEILDSNFKPLSGNEVNKDNSVKAKPNVDNDRSTLKRTSIF